MPCAVLNAIVILQVAPMSLYSLLGSHGATVRDVFVRRLSAKTEDIDLKVAILEFITVAIETQPALTELFLCLKPSNNSDGQEVWLIIRPLNLLFVSTVLIIYNRCMI